MPWVNKFLKKKSGEGVNYLKILASKKQVIMCAFRKGWFFKQWRWRTARSIVWEFEVWIGCVEAIEKGKSRGYDNGWTPLGITMWVGRGGGGGLGNGRGVKVTEALLGEKWESPESGKGRHGVLRRGKLLRRTLNTKTWTSFCFSLQLLFYFSQSVDIRRGGKTRIRTSLLSDTDSYNSVVQTPKPVSIQTHLIVAGLQQP